MRPRVTACYPVDLGCLRFVATVVGRDVRGCECDGAARADAPNSDAWWFNGALAHKFVRNWPKAFELGRQAAARAETGKRDPAFWNLGIAATILNDWGVARAAWKGYGIALSDGDGDGEIDGDFGTACVRLETGHAPEVVWVRRICPTRARVLSIPFSDRRFGEVVVHDGAPNGERIVDGRRYPVFDELMLHKASETPTWRVSLSCPAEADAQALVDGFDAEGLPIEPVSGMVLRSRAESEGSVEIYAGAARSGEHDVLLAAPDEAAARSLPDAWARSGTGGRAWTGLREKKGSIVPAPSAASALHTRTSMETGIPSCRTCAGRSTAASSPRTWAWSRIAASSPARNRPASSPMTVTGGGRHSTASTPRIPGRPSSPA